MAAVRYRRLTERDVKAALGGPSGPVYADLARRAQRVVNKAKRLAPVDNGTLRNSITFELGEKRGRPVARIGTNVTYARWVHDGTGIYGPRGTPIRPVRAQVLRWPVRGTSGSTRSRVPGRGRVLSKSAKPTAYAFARSVRGSPPRPFLRDALDAGRGKSYVRLAKK